MKEVLTLSEDNNLQVSADAAGVISTLFALAYVSELSQVEKYSNSYHLLLDFAEQHQESCAILQPLTRLHPRKEYNKCASRFW
ncbi:MAG: antirestriction protein [Tatlockia sp.]|nr:antirestriction protein [Tatlockia sp.]